MSAIDSAVSSIRFNGLRSFMQPISAAGRRALHQYTNKGVDHSISLRLFLRSFHVWFMRFIPERMAPNVVTMLGFVCVLFSYILAASYSPSLQSSYTAEKMRSPLHYFGLMFLSETWVYAFAAVCLFLYQTLDNCDGKQAVRTRSSSPLGELFDHGVDALAVTFAGLTLASSLNLGPSLMALLMLVVAWVPFLTATWEEFHTGALILGQVNGPIEGILMCCGVHLISGFWSPAWWDAPAPALLTAALPPAQKVLSALTLGYVVPGDLLLPFSNFTWTRSEMVIMFVAIGAVTSVVSNISNVLRTLRVSGKPVLPAIVHLAPGFFHIVLAVSWVVADPTTFFLNTRLVCIVVGLVHGFYVSNMTLAHCVKSPCAVVHAPSIILFALAFNARQSIRWMNPASALFLAFITVVFMWSSYVLAVIDHITEELGIRVFSLEKVEKVPVGTSDATSGSPSSP
eukprot:ANDGO_08533.mRNA.1 putative CDP-alcohol phosphatidyltransferase class-I family protein 3